VSGLASWLVWAVASVPNQCRSFWACTAHLSPFCPATCACRRRPDPHPELGVPARSAGRPGRLPVPRHQQLLPHRRGPEALQGWAGVVPTTDWKLAAPTQQTVSCASTRLLPCSMPGVQPGLGGASSPCPLPCMLPWAAGHWVLVEGGEEALKEAVLTKGCAPRAGNMAAPASRGWEVGCPMQCLNGATVISLGGQPSLLVWAWLAAELAELAHAPCAVLVQPSSSDSMLPCLAPNLCLPADRWWCQVSSSGDAAAMPAVGQCRQACQALPAHTATYQHTSTTLLLLPLPLLRTSACRPPLSLRVRNCGLAVLRHHRPTICLQLTPATTRSASTLGVCTTTPTAPPRPPIWTMLSSSPAMLPLRTARTTGW